MEEVIQVEHLVKKFPTCTAVKDITFSVHAGEIFGVIGPNGAGKSTTLEILEGMQRATSGKVRVLGLDPMTEAHEIKKHIGVVFQNTLLQDKIKVYEALQLFASFYPNFHNTEQIMRRFDLSAHRNRYFQDLSGGLQQRLLLALATLHKPKILFLDEPSTGLDPHSRQTLREMLRDLRKDGTTILLTTHYMEEAEQLCDRIALLHRGRLVGLDTPKQLVQRLKKRLRCSSSLRSSTPPKHSACLQYTSANGYRLTVTNQQTAAEQLFRLAKESGWTIEEFQFDTGTLDELFVSWAEEEVKAT